MTVEPLRTLFLDAGGVIIDPNWERVAQALRDRGVAVTGAELRAAEPHAKRAIDDVLHVRATDDSARGLDLFRLVLERCGIPPSAATDAALTEVRGYHARHNLWETVIDGAVPALEALRAAGFVLVVVSNANGRLHALLERVELLRHFDVVIDSYVEGVEKPDPRLFEIALARAGAEAQTTLHAGDLYQIDVVGARAAGLRQALIDPAGLYPDADCPRFASLAELARAATRREL
jgi:HAD superfamily hydrolase (TIGR01509 family)